MSLFSRIGAPAAINTSAANTFGGSGSQSATTQAQPSLFGGATTTAAPATGGLFGTSTNTTTQAPTAGGLFGQPAASTGTGGGLFGSSTAGQTQNTGGGLFGASNTTQAKPSLFGSSTTTGGGLFGGMNNATNQPAAGGGLFGANTQTQSTGGLFSGQQSHQPQQQQGGGLFGGGGGSMFGQSQQQQQPQQQQQQQGQQGQQQAVQMNFTNLRGTTRYEELHQDIKSTIEFLEGHIQDQMKLSQQISARSVAQKETMESVDADVDLVSRKFSNTNSVLITDGTSIGHLNNSASHLLNTASLSTRTIDILRLPISQRSHYLSSHHTNNAEFSLIPYFQEQAQDMERKTENYLGALGEVERTLEGMEKEIGQGGGEGRAKEVVRAERMVFAGLVAVAGRVAGLNEDLKNLSNGR